MMNRNLVWYDAEPVGDSLREAVLAGLRRRPRAIAPKFFYDAEGSRLFDAICRTPEYYPTRTEMTLLSDRAEGIAATIRAATGPEPLLLIEPGAGSGDKARLLFDALRPVAYLPIDISGEYLRAVAAELAAERPWLAVHALCDDFTTLDRLPIETLAGRRLIFFPGSTIGNYEPEQARAFLSRMARLAGPDGWLLLGVDLVKPPHLLEAAYNDRGGMTAAFNRNLLVRINREVGGDFRPEQFTHRAHYDAERNRIEMHLISCIDQTVQVAGERFRFAAGESIHTENAYKYTPEGCHSLLTASGFAPVQSWQDPQGWFSVQCARVDASIQPAPGAG